MKKKAGSKLPPRAEVMRVFQTREETKRFYNKISKFYDFLSEQTEATGTSIGAKVARSLSSP